MPVRPSAERLSQTGTYLCQVATTAPTGTLHVFQCVTLGLVIEAGDHLVYTAATAHSDKDLDDLVQRADIQRAAQVGHCVARTEYHSSAGRCCRWWPSP